MDELALIRRGLDKDFDIYNKCIIKTANDFNISKEKCQEIIETYNNKFKKFHDFFRIMDDDIRKSSKHFPNKNLKILSDYNNGIIGIEEVKQFVKNNIKGNIDNDDVSLEGKAAKKLWNLTKLYNKIYRVIEEDKKLNLLNNKNISSFNDIDYSKFNLVTLVLGYTQIDTLKGANFSGLSNLEELYLNNTQINTLKGVNFTGLSKLRELSLSCTPIKTLEGADFSGLDNLNYLSFECSKLDTLEGVNFSGLHNLKVLKLNNTQLKTLEGVDFSGLDKLKELDLSFTKIKTLEGVDFSKLPELEILILSSKKIKVDFDFSKLRKFKKIVIEKLSMY